MMGVSRGARLFDSMGVVLETNSQLTFAGTKARDPSSLGCGGARKSLLKARLHN